MTKEQYDGIADAFDQAEESVVPFPVVTEDEISVVGDANLTEIKKSDFRITFYVPEKKEDGTFSYAKTEKVFKDVHIRPRDSVEIESAAAMIRPYFVKLTEAGGVEKLSDPEKLEILRKFDREIMDHVYDLVSLVLRVDPALKDYMHPGDVMDACVKILLEYQDMVNAADGFFG